MNKQTVDIIGGFIPDLNGTIVIDSVLVTLPTIVLSTKCTFWLSIGQTYTIDGFDYKVESFVINESITVTRVGHANVPVAPTTFIIAAPEYIHGTLKMAANEVDGKSDKTILCPFVYLFEIITDRKNTDEESMIDREVDLRMFFLNSVDTGNWLTDDHYSYFVDPMQQMVDLFIEVIEESGRFTDNMRYECTPLINVSEQGNQEKENIR